jgi:hypothetical protein
MKCLNRPRKGRPRLDFWFKIFLGVPSPGGGFYFSRPEILKNSHTEHIRTGGYGTRPGVWVPGSKILGARTGGNGGAVARRPG